MKLHPELEKMAAVILDLTGEYRSRPSASVKARLERAWADFHYLRAEMAVQLLRAAGVPSGPGDLKLEMHARGINTV